MSTMKPEPPATVSVLVALFNDAAHVESVHREVMDVMTGLDAPFEVLYVDDGSTDATFEMLRTFHRADPRVRVLRFARHFGLQTAQLAGLHHARGRAVVLFDPDLQLSPEGIPLMLAKLAEGYDVVYTENASPSVPLWRHWGRVTAHWLIRRFTGIAMPNNASGMLVLNRQLVEVTSRYNRKARPLDGLIAWLAYGRCAIVPIPRRALASKRPKHTVWDYAKRGLNVIILFSSKPLQLAFWCGCATLGLSLLVGAWWLVQLNAKGWAAAEPALFAAALTFLSGVQLSALGVMGEYIGRIYGEVRQHPLYVVAEVLGDDLEPGNGVTPPPSA